MRADFFDPALGANWSREKSPRSSDRETRHKGEKVYHFDFGHELRNIADLGRPSECLREKELFFIRNILDKGLLLENEHFPVAEKIVRQFLHRNYFRADDLLILNGVCPDIEIRRRI